MSEQAIDTLTRAARYLQEQAGSQFWYSASLRAPVDLLFRIASDVRKECVTKLCTKDFPQAVSDCEHVQEPPDDCLKHWPLRIMEQEKGDWGMSDKQIPERWREDLINPQHWRLPTCIEELGAAEAKAAEQATIIEQLTEVIKRIAFETKDKFALASSPYRSRQATKLAHDIYAIAYAALNPRKPK